MLLRDRAELWAKTSSRALYALEDCVTFKPNGMTCLYAYSFMLLERSGNKIKPLPSLENGFIPGWVKPDEWGYILIVDEKNCPFETAMRHLGFDIVGNIDLQFRAYDDEHGTAVYSCTSNNGRAKFRMMMTAEFLFRVEVVLTEEDDDNDENVYYLGAFDSMNNARRACREYLARLAKQEMADGNPV